MSKYQCGKTVGTLSMLGSEVQTYLGHEDLQHVHVCVFLFQVKFGGVFLQKL